MKKIDRIIKELNQYQGLICLVYHKISDIEDPPKEKYILNPVVYVYELDLEKYNKSFLFNIKSFDTAYYSDGKFFYTNSSRVVVNHKRKFGSPIAKKYAYWRWPSQDNPDFYKN